MTTIDTLTDTQLEALERQAFARGDALQGYICRVALGAEFSASELNDDSCLSPAEQRQIEAMTRDDARAECLRVIRDAEAQR